MKISRFKCDLCQYKKEKNDVIGVIINAYTVSFSIDPDDADTHVCLSCAGKIHILFAGVDKSFEKAMADVGLREISNFLMQFQRFGKQEIINRVSFITSKNVQKYLSLLIENNYIVKRDKDSYISCYPLKDCSSYKDEVMHG